MTVRAENISLSPSTRFPSRVALTFASQEALNSQIGWFGQTASDLSVPAANQVRFGVGANGAVTFACGIPHAIIGALGLDQFVEAQQTSNTGTAANSTRFSLFLFMRGGVSTFDNQFVGFRVAINNVAPSLDVQSLTAYNPPGSAAIASVAQAVANGDVLRFEGRRIAGPLIQLDVLLNGVNVLSTTSALVPAANVGLPAFGWGSNPAGGGVQCTYEDIVVGRL